MGRRPGGTRQDVHQLGLDLGRRVTAGEPKPARDPEDVRVDGNRIGPEGVRHHDVRGLPANSRKSHEGFPLPRDLAAMRERQLPARRDDVAGLAAKETAGPDVGLELGRLEGGDRGGIGMVAKEPGRDRVDPGVGALGAQDRGDQELERGVVA